MFIFAIYGIQIIGGKLARCNDQTYYNEQVGHRSGGVIPYELCDRVETVQWDLLARTIRVENERERSRSSDAGSTRLVGLCLDG